ncbi:hypothetical protein C8T65DRAFT_763903 [Cerioporus squamosus]|nr:hypothetical protein C8T65DRAFT_763903 [Cerioporus squamosus]
MNTNPGTPPAASAPSEYVFGDICTVRERISTPIEQVFMQSEGFGSKPHVRDQCRRNFEALIDPTKPLTGKDRPCVIMSPSVPVDSAETTICLKMTMDKTPFKQLPLIVKFFGVVVAPNKLAEEKEHVHSEPEWPHPQQLLLAIPFTTKRPIKGLWPRGRANGVSDTGKPTGHKRNAPRSTATPLADDGAPVYKYDRDTMVWVVNKCDKVLEKWAQNCIEDPHFASVYESDYRRCCRIAANGSTASLASWCSTDRNSTRKVYRSSTSLPVLHEVVNVAVAVGPKACSLPNSKQGNGRKASKWSMKSRRSQRSFTQETTAAN